jgi:hypothetical protein
VEADDESQASAALEGGKVTDAVLYEATDMAIVQVETA